MSRIEAPLSPLPQSVAELQHDVQVPRFLQQLALVDPQNYHKVMGPVHKAETLARDGHVLTKPMAEATPKISLHDLRVKLGNGYKLPPNTSQKSRPFDPDLDEFGL